MDSTVPLLESDKAEIQRKKTRDCFIGWFAMVVTIISSAARIPFLKLVDAPQLLKMSWRQQSMIPWIGMFALYDLWGVKVDYFPWKRFALSQLFYIPYTQAYVFAPNYTSTATVALFLGANVIFIILFRIIRGVHQSKMKIVGTIVGFVGFGVTVSNAFTVDEDDMWSLLIGDGLALLACIGRAGFYEILDPILKAKYPSSIVTVMQTGLSMIFWTVFCFFYFDISFDPNTGVFGWLHPDRVVMCLFGVGLINGIGNCSSYFTVKYMDLVLYQMMCLFIPIGATILSYLIGTDPAPELTFYFGSALMLGGVVVIIKYG